MSFFQNIKNALEKGHIFYGIYGRYFKKVVEILLRVTERISYDVTH